MLRNTFYDAVYVRKYEPDYVRRAKGCLEMYKREHLEKEPF
jgi:hypothetical protein